MKRQNTNETKRKRGAALRRTINSLEDLDPEKEYAWVKLLRQHHRPVHRLRVSSETTEVVKSGGQDLWRVGRDILQERAAIQLAKNYILSQKKPIWGLFTKRERNIKKQLMKK